MKAALFIPLLALADASVILRRDDPGSSAQSYHFKTQQPHFFNLKVDDCKWTKRQEEDEEEELSLDDEDETPEIENAKILPGKGSSKWNRCPLAGYAIRLENGIVVATPYQKWYDPKLATFFVDDDTQLYTVSKDPLQLYIDSVTGAFKYTKLGWLPPSAISTSFYHTGNNPLGLTSPSPSYLSWPSTVGIAFDGEWAFCPLGETGQYQVFVNNANFAQQGVRKDWCKKRPLAAVNANPWRNTPNEAAE
ncbi:unnamed protein product [Periconia digitata]|uniref:Uncharacterized protein n=1 Tax=Periconia digitata TaxID=1303443 RepID=A0A9W4XVS3_9PLEO|nr:unnamed protein product [Periconia digitata]